MNIAVYIIIVVVSGFFILQRLYNNFKTSREGKAIVEKITGDPAFKQEVIGELVCLYASKHYSESSDNIRTAFKFTENKMPYKNMAFEYVDFVNNNYLIIVKYSSSDFDVVGLSRKMKLGEVKVINQFNFLAKKNETAGAYELYSNVYYDLGDKLLRMEVANKILDIMK